MANPENYLVTALIAMVVLIALGCFNTPSSRGVRNLQVTYYYHLNCCTLGLVQLKLLFTYVRWKSKSLLTYLEPLCEAHFCILPSVFLFIHTRSCRSSFFWTTARFIWWWPMTGIVFYTITESCFSCTFFSKFIIRGGIE